VDEISVVLVRLELSVAVIFRAFEWSVVVDVENHRFLFMANEKRLGRNSAFFAGKFLADAGGYDFN
jgi:hypothetical protein